MANHPYLGLHGGAFWRSGVAEASPFDMDGLYRPKFAISPGERIATAGSCFAQHISREVRARGYGYLDVEPAPPWLNEALQPMFGYGMYSARFGNIYTMAQLAQLAQEAAGAIAPHEPVWERDGAFFDPLRPSVEPEGLKSIAEVAMQRRFHLARVRELFLTMDVFIFTLGLTEAWRCMRSDRIYPIAPGVLAGTFDADAFAFVNFRYADVVSQFQAFMNALATIRGALPAPKVILTVSPVPLTATASGEHALQATSYSKSVLRAAAGDLAAASPSVDYFPSYEIITNPASRGVFFDANLRSVRRTGVDTVMRLFFSSHRLQAEDTPAPDVEAEPVEPSKADVDMARIESLRCEESVLEAFRA